MKKISRRSFLKVAGIGAAALGLAACGGSSASTTTSTASSTAASAGGSDADFTNTTLTLYSPGGENSVPTKTIIKYGELIEEATGGAVKCDVQYGGTLGNDAEAIESTRMGTIDLIFAGTSGFTSFYDKAKVMDLPFLFTSAEEANEVLNSTDIGEQIFADFGDYDLVYLAEGDNGMRHVSTVKSWGQIEKADDVIGLKIRVPQSQMYTDCWSTLGYPRGTGSDRIDHRPEQWHRTGTGQRHLPRSSKCYLGRYRLLQLYQLYVDGLHHGCQQDRLGQAERDHPECAAREGKGSCTVQL